MLANRWSGPTVRFGFDDRTSARGLVALWRESLLAQAVLQGKTKGYRHHPQLHRFRDCASARGAIAEYLREVHAEATIRGYTFDARKISRARTGGRLPVTRGQLTYEWGHLLAKLAVRDPARHRLLASRRPEPHPLFRVVAGGVEAWERQAETVRPPRV
jgi:hypothetical protein